MSEAIEIEGYTAEVRDVRPSETARYCDSGYVAGIGDKALCKRKPTKRVTVECRTGGVVWDTCCDRHIKRAASVLAWEASYADSNKEK